MHPRMEFIDEAFPLLVSITPRQVDAQAVEEMKAGYERYFARGERYALVTYTEGGVLAMPAVQRRAVVDWINEPRVQAAVRRCCILSANVVVTPFQRAVLKALLWFHDPPAPQVVVTSPEEAVDLALRAIDAAGLKMTMSHAEARALVLPRFRPKSPP